MAISDSQNMLKEVDYIFVIPSGVEGYGYHLILKEVNPIATRDYKAIYKPLYLRLSGLRYTGETVVAFIFSGLNHLTEVRC